jgi:MinD-like ATPase involved in chromosome partitioning or flagellar assembly
MDAKHTWSVLDALENAGELDYSLWTKYVTKVHNVDFLLADPKKRVLPSWTNYHHLLDFAASRYDHILVDLPEMVNDATVETVRRAKSVFVVCTPELPSLALAPQRCRNRLSQRLWLKPPNQSQRP